MLISNPPYISRAAFARATARSVRNHEPRLALVPDDSKDGGQGRRHPEDVFYARLLELAGSLRPRRVLLEVGGWEQAVRVVEMAVRDGPVAGLYRVVEIWRDEPDAAGWETERIAGREVGVRGTGQGRSVYLFRGGA